MHHITQHARSHLAGHTFLGHARPRKINTSQPYLGTTERSARRSKSYGAGVWAHRPLHTCTLRTQPVSRPSNLHYKGSCITRSNPARAAQSLTSKRASADTTTPVAHILSRVAVSAYKVNDPTQIKYQDLGKRVIMKQPRTLTRARPTSRLGGLNLPCRSATK